MTCKLVEIALFDTDPAEQYQLDDMLSAVMFSRDDFQITFYTSYTLFACDMAQKRKCFDLLFVNVTTPDNAGLMAAEYARRLSDTIEIVLTGMDYSGLKLGYRVKALNYIVKPYDKAQITETIDRFYEFFEKDDCFSFKNGFTTEKIKVSHILYFYSCGRKVQISVIGSDDVEFYGKLDEVEDLMVSKGFVRTHQSYLVNIKSVRGIMKDRMLMENGDEIPVSRNRFDEIKDIFMQYVRAV